MYRLTKIKKDYENYKKSESILEKKAFIRNIGLIFAAVGLGLYLIVKNII